MIFHLFRRYLVSYRADIYSLLSISLILPIMLYILVVISVMMIIKVIGNVDGEPVIRFMLNEIDIFTNYEQFSSIGIWIVSSCFFSIYVSSATIYRLIFQDRQLDMIHASPVSYFDVFSSLVLCSFTLGVIQLALSIGFTYFIGIVNPMSFLQILLTIANILLLILLSSVIGIVVGSINKSILSMLLSYISIMFFLIFISGTFIPKSLLVDKMQNIIIYVPYVSHIESIQGLYLIDKFNFFPAIGTLAFCVMFSIMNIIYGSYYLRK